MKITHLIYSEQVAGAEKYLLDLLPGLTANGITCDLICVCPLKAREKFESFCDDLNSKGVSTILLTGAVIHFLRIARQINQHLCKNNAGYLHAHLFKADLLAVMVKKLFNKKIILLSTKHGYEESYLNDYPVNQGKKIRYNLYYFIAKYLARTMDEQFAVSKSMADIYFDLKLSAQRMQYIQHGINVSIQQVAIDTAQFKLGTPQLIIVGRIEEVKGHQYLLKAMPDIIKVFPDIRLLVIGNGTQKEQLIQLAKDTGITNNILFLDYQSDPYPFIAHSDIMVMTSMFESFGLVLIEAFALKVPVVAFDVPAGNEIIINNETGLLVPVYDSKCLAEKIIQLLQNPAERERLSLNAYNNYISYYNSSRMIKETVNWYTSMIVKKYSV